MEPEVSVMEPEPTAAASSRSRLEQAAAANFQFLWRTVRRLGVSPDAAVDDAVQRVFEAAARKCELIQPGRERAFLFKAAVLVAAEERRAGRRARALDDAAELDAAADPRPLPDQLLDERRRRALLDQALEALDADTRAVFVLFELEGLTSTAIAALLDVPVGTVASRLRRARQQFHAEVRRIRLRHPEGDPR